ncbi:hypothetical protein [Dyadobacter fermentans]|uniref:Uncharacterized protein n=1 Tax=Dyadobacter fermentans (strain ATCC 700827 / DSM 18053 / CIP 107007 / KCTC 52180 / NS114) TaxID=471854 RepID=C6VV98_DYAFD|nr:hypothetical protein [Dyadobacter fermentans]ACT94921.1 hypothetical protein Dfer_3716 [Dyadobacter fermentans DSM 18053]
MGNQTAFEKFNVESLVDPLFLPYVKEYLALESDEERNDFWETRKIDADQETITAAWRYGMQRLAERADDLKRRVIAAQCAEQH